MGNRPFQVPRLAAYLILPLLLAGASLWVRFAPPANPAETPRLNMALPAELGAFSGSLILHCQNAQCLKTYPVRRAGDLAACPGCGGALLPIALSEKTVLPADTTITRRLYRASGSPVYTVTIVLAGSDTRSIHRPQQCLPAQGYRIDAQHRQTLAVGPDRRLDVVRIDARSGMDARSRFGFVYWFVGANRTTSSHLARLFWTMRDQLFRNRPSRWAYVAITLGEPLDTPESLQRLSAFLQLLLPALETPAPEAA